MDYKKTIEEVLMTAVTEKTFSLEIIEKIKSLKDGFDKSQDIIKDLRKLIDNRNEMLDVFEKDRDALALKVASYEARESDIATKEKTFEKNTYELSFQKSRADEIKDLFKIVFRNPTVQSSVFESGNDGKGNYVNSNKNTTTEVNSNHA